MKGDRLYSLEIENLLINGAYGELSLEERRRLNKLLNSDPRLKRKYDEIKLTANMAGKIKYELPSPGFEDNIFESVGLKKNKDSGFSSDIMWILVNRPYKIGAAFSLMFLIVIFSLFTDLRFQEQNYTEREILSANKEASEALMMVSKVFNKTSEEFAEGILKTRVSAPLKKGLGIVNSILTNGEQNENNL